MRSSARGRLVTGFPGPRKTEQRGGRGPRDGNNRGTRDTRGARSRDDFRLVCEKTSGPTVGRVGRRKPLFPQCVHEDRRSHRSPTPGHHTGPSLTLSCSYWFSSKTVCGSPGILLGFSVIYIWGSWTVAHFGKVGNDNKTHGCGTRYPWS